MTSRSGRLGLAEVHEALHSGVDPDGTLLLDGELLPELADALACYGVSGVAVRDAKVEHGATVVVHGNADLLLGAGDQPLHLEIAGDDDRVARLSYALPSSWSFASAYPGLPESYKHLDGNPGLVSLQPSLLYDLVFDSASVTSQSGSTALAFTGTMSSSAAFTFLVEPLGIPDKPTFRGTIVPSSSGPASVDVSLTTTGTLSIGALHITGAGVHIYTTGTPDPEAGVPLTRADIVGTLNVGAPVKLAAPFNDQAGVMKLTADVSGAGLSLATGIDALAKLVGIDATVLALPAPLDATSALELQTVSCTAGFDAPYVQGIGVTVGTTIPWPIASGLKVEGLTFGWTIAYPFDASLRWVSTVVLGTLLVGTTTPLQFGIAAYADSGFTVQGTLLDPASLGQIVTTVVGHPVGGVPDLEVEYVEVDASITGDFSIDVQLGDWTFEVGGEPVKVIDVNAAVGRSGGVTSAQLMALFTIAGVPLFVSADLASGGEGMSFSGGTFGDGVAISLDTLASDVFSIFRVTLPSSLPEATLSSLTVSFATSATEAADFHFHAEGTAALGPGAKLTLDVHLAKKKDGTYEGVFGGTLTLGTRTFKLAFDEVSPHLSLLVASYDSGGTSDSVDVHDLVADVSSDLAEVVPEGISVGAKELALLTWSFDGTRGYAFNLDLSAAIDLTQLPLIGDKLPAALAVGVEDLIVDWASAQLSKDVASAVNPLLPQDGQLPAAGLPAGVTLGAVVELAGTPQPVSLAVPQAPTGTPQPQGGAPSPSAPGGAWIDVQRQFGPVHVARVGALYQNNALLFAIDADVQLGPLTVSLDGLAVGSLLSQFDPVFRLDGLGVTYTTSGLAISGALLRDPATQLAPDVAFQYDGAVAVEAEEVALAAIGSYAQPDVGKPSLFLFAHMNTQLGGPPAFFVTGLMGGFGLNRSLAIPAQDEVLNFPLLALGASGAGVQDAASVLRILEGRPATSGDPPTKAWVLPDPGAWWLAVGVEFTSFEIVDTQALLIAEDAGELEFALVGLSTLQLPQESDSGTPYVYAQLQLDAVLKPSEGLFGTTAILSSSSYVIDPACHLTGGFAFYSWFGSNVNAGQFVLTIGGYHPDFDVPSYFPTVPRLGFNWAVSDDVTIQGNAYFALTTSCVMGGGSLEVLFQDGDLTAWFTAAADVLVSWRPFFYEADVDVSIGVAYRLNLGFCHKTIEVSIGADVTLWGPPTGGRAHVELWCVSFTVSFGPGEPDTKDEALEWAGFSKLLPDPEKILTATPLSGVSDLQDTTDPVAGNPAKRWVGRATGLSFRTVSAVPASALACAGAEPFRVGGGGATIPVKPMDLSEVTSTVTLTVHQGSLDAAAHDLTGWTVEPYRRNLPATLWSAPPEDFTQIPAQPSAAVVPDQLVGYTVTPPPPQLAAPRGLVSIAVLEERSIANGWLPLVPAAAATADYVPVVDDTSVGLVGGIHDVADMRSKLFDALAAARIFKGEDDDMSALARAAAHSFSDPPLVEL